MANFSCLRFSCLRFFSDVRLPSFSYVSSAGKISLDNVFQERERLNHNIVGKEVFLMGLNFTEH